MDERKRERERERERKLSFYLRALFIGVFLSYLSSFILSHVRL